MLNIRFVGMYDKFENSLQANCLLFFGFCCYFMPSHISLNIFAEPSTFFFLSFSSDQSICNKNKKSKVVSFVGKIVSLFRLRGKNAKKKKKSPDRNLQNQHHHCYRNDYDCCAAQLLLLWLFVFVTHHHPIGTHFHTFKCQTIKIDYYFLFSSLKRIPIYVYYTVYALILLCFFRFFSSIFFFFSRSYIFQHK